MTNEGFWQRGGWNLSVFNVFVLTKCLNKFCNKAFFESCEGREVVSFDPRLNFHFLRNTQKGRGHEKKS